MRAGILKYPIEIWQVTVSTNEFNEQTDTYTKSFETRANITYNSGTRSDINDETVYPQTLNFEVREYVPVGEFDHIKYNGKFYRILSLQIDDTNLQHSMMKKIICELIND